MSTRLTSSAVHAASLSLAVCLLALAPPASGDAPTCRAIVVTKTNVSFPHSTTIQAAVDQASPCDWILIAPGAYAGSVVIRTPDVHLRGLDRTRVVIDGRHHRGVNGIEVRADGVWVENLAVRNFDRAGLNGRGGSQIWWDGVRRWHGNYLTVYDTGLLGGYGLYAERSSWGEWDRVYASGFNDSGLYVGGCRDCRTTITRAVAERNPVGYAGTNSGGHLIVQDSLFRDNAVGLSVNSGVSDPPPPQLGTCDAAANRTPTPEFTSTRLRRCTIFRHNLIAENNNLTVPSDTTAGRPGFGIGIVLLGAYGDLVEQNRFFGNREIGILGLEAPFRPSARPHPIHFQVAGNRVQQNFIRGSRFGIAIEGGLFGSRRSVDNCFWHNRYARSFPVDLRPLSCLFRRTPNPEETASWRILRLVRGLHREFLARRARGQAAPSPQATMPDPCRGAPPNPLCGWPRSARLTRDAIGWGAST